MDFYEVQPLREAADPIAVSVPSSKSILNRALALAAFLKGTCLLRCGEYGSDTRDMLSCLAALGIRTEQVPDGILVYGCGGDIPRREAVLQVGSAGTAARFLTAMLAFRGGNYELHASAQMETRPMDFLNEFAAHGVGIEPLAQRTGFPFKMTSAGLSAHEFTVDTDVSTQFASGVMLAAAAGDSPFTLKLTGKRTRASYIAMTAALLEQFGAHCTRKGNTIVVTPAREAPAEFSVEPDLSGACYFYAIALLCGVRVLVRGVRPESLQGDVRFLELLKRRGVRLIATENGLLADGTSVKRYRGFRVNMRDFSDQTLTVAALAPFADTPSVLRGISHIRKQECDRVQAIAENLTSLGVPVSATENEIRIRPAKISGGTIKTYDDHRVAMAFALIGLKCGGIRIENPGCTAKTFGNYFKLLDFVTKR